MSGHSKWHNIQAKKGKTDAARAAVFTKIGRELAYFSEYCAARRVGLALFCGYIVPF